MPPLPQLGYGDYLSEAFQASPVIKGMGPVPVNKVFLAGAFILGFANIGFWFLACALEFIYLYYLSTDPRFQKWVQAKGLKVVDVSRSEQINAMIANMDAASKKRLQTLKSNLDEITRLMNIDSMGAPDFMKETKERTLQQLSDVFLRMLFSKRVINESLQNTDADKIKREAKELSQQLQDPGVSDAMSRSLQANLEIQERRLENVKKAEENLALVEMEMKRIENQVQLIREEVAINRSPEALSSTLDRIGNTLSETEAWINTHSDFFSKVAGNDDQSPISPALKVSAPSVTPPATSVAPAVSVAEEHPPEPPPKLPEGS